MSGLTSEDGGFVLGPMGQIALGVGDLAASEAFYGGVLGLVRLGGDGGGAYYDCGEVRLLLRTVADHAEVRPGSPLYFRVSDIVSARRDLEGRGVAFTDAVHRVATIGGMDLWQTSFADPDGHPLALMSEGPAGFQP